MRPLQYIDIGLQSILCNLVNNHGARIKNINESHLPRFGYIWNVSIATFPNEICLSLILPIAHPKSLKRANFKVH